ncbi:MAG: hypothetical protein KDB74_08535 [Flavobacteriales bacterium]|nr:hypothetical protein [Flavobacteriales bacterium]
MTLGKVLTVFGIVLIVYAVISGLNLHLTINDGNWIYSNRYTFKIGTIIIGFLLIYLGKRAQK